MKVFVSASLASMLAGYIACVAAGSGTEEGGYAHYTNFSPAEVVSSSDEASSTPEVASPTPETISPVLEVTSTVLKVTYPVLEGTFSSYEETVSSPKVTYPVLDVASSSDDTVPSDEEVVSSDKEVSLSDEETSPQSKPASKRPLQPYAVCRHPSRSQFKSTEGDSSSRLVPTEGPKTDGSGSEGEIGIIYDPTSAVEVDEGRPCKPAAGWIRTICKKGRNFTRKVTPSFIPKAFKSAVSKVRSSPKVQALTALSVILLATAVLAALGHYATPEAASGAIGFIEPLELEQVNSMFASMLPQALPSSFCGSFWPSITWAGAMAECVGPYQNVAGTQCPSLEYLDRFSIFNGQLLDEAARSKFWTVPMERLMAHIVSGSTDVPVLEYSSALDVQAVGDSVAGALAANADTAAAAAADPSTLETVIPSFPELLKLVGKVLPRN